MLIQFLQKNKFFRRIIYRAGKKRAQDMVGRIKPFLNKSDTILDIGSGTCNICEILLENNYRVFPLDVLDLSFVDGLKPIIYDEKKIPYGDDHFDKALILTVLHHTSDPENVLEEAKRVADKIIIVEDIYLNRWHKYATFFLDSLMNFEFIGHPHSNKSDKQWRKTFEDLGLKLLDVKYHHSNLIFKHADYYLEK